MVKIIIECDKPITVSVKKKDEDGEGEDNEAEKAISIFNARK